jgi:hypothetical protein
MVDGKYLRFEEIPECFYDGNLDRGEWEERSIDELVKIGYYKVVKGDNSNFGQNDSVDIFPEDFFVYESDPLKHFENNKEKLEIEYKQKIKEAEERQSRIENDPKRIYWDNDLRQFLYNKGVEIPTNEMSREFYLKNRIKPVERRNLVDLLSGYSESMFGLHDDVYPYGYALIGIGTSTYSEEYFDDLKATLAKDGFDEETEYTERSWATVDQGIKRAKTYAEYVEQCFNGSEAFDYKKRPLGKKHFKYIRRAEQERYSVKKNLGDYFEMKGEDLDFSICLEELYGESCGNNPSSRYVENKEFTYHLEKFIDIFKKNFISYLSKNDFSFKEEISYLDSGLWDKDEEGNLVRTKNIKDSNINVSTVRVNFPEGRSLHFYFQNHMADMKVKKEKVDNDYFVQLMRGQFGSFNPIEDLGAAIENGEKTGVFENPLVLKWKKAE